VLVLLFTEKLKEISGKRYKLFMKRLFFNVYKQCTKNANSNIKHLKCYDLVMIILTTSLIIILYSLLSIITSQLYFNNDKHKLYIELTEKTKVQS